MILMLKLKSLKADVESNESDDIIIESYVGPSSEGPGKGVRIL
jgi:hypothetical protein